MRLICLFLLLKCMVHPTRKNKKAITHHGRLLSLSSFSPVALSNWVAWLRCFSYNRFRKGIHIKDTPLFLCLINTQQRRHRLHTICMRYVPRASLSSLWWGCLEDTPHHHPVWWSPKQTDGSYKSPHVISLTMWETWHSLVMGLRKKNPRKPQTLTFYQFKQKNLTYKTKLKTHCNGI